ncbi:hypothetical protein CYPRO_0845 [Cyclonatronum proteinivorum]|uniref:Uncharacterized protein n=2 Tax=Cyclonatronum proteinivorum TaxID=1457365 RepID=A0A345UI20_9BACT|nr:hypothetical protein CYPRO_0845 [Cyclonatronum proteinivorum]
MLAILFMPVLLSAQPSATQLLNDIKRTNAGYLSGVETVSLVNAMEGFGFTMQEREHYRKITEAGHTRLVGEEEGDDISMVGLLNLSADDLAALVNGASRIGTERRDGQRMITLFVDDPDVIESFGDPLPEADDEDDFEDFSFVSMKLWIGAADYLLYHVESTLENDQGAQMEVIFTLSDYERHSGLPLPGQVEVTMKGLGALMDDSELAETRRELEEMMAELENMPEAQRNMILSQMGPQLEQFEQMMEGGDTSFAIKIQDVRINE